MGACYRQSVAIECHGRFLPALPTKKQTIGAKTCAKNVKTDLVIVGEPTDLTVVYTHKGTAWTEWEARESRPTPLCRKPASTPFELLTKRICRFEARISPALCGSREFVAWPAHDQPGNHTCRNEDQCGTRPLRRGSRYPNGSGPGENGHCSPRFSM